MISIGAAIIAKDNEKTIFDTLDSVKDICKQIVIVDTGSSDKTSEISLKFGAEIHYLLWNDNFSEARNYAINLMRTDWILIIDTDEIISSFAYDEFVSIVNNSKCGAINVKIENLLENGLISEHFYPRMIKNNSNIKFIGAIHEQISESIQNIGFTIEKSSFVIEHSGYKTTNKEKINRNKFLLEKQLQESEDDWTKYHLANTEFANNNYTKAEYLYNEIENSIELSPLQIENVKLKLAQIYLSKNEFEKIENKLSFVSNDINNEGFKNYLLIVKSLSTKEIEKSEELLKNNSIYFSNLVDKNQIQKIKEIIPKIKKYSH